MTAAQARFITESTAVVSAPLVPEVRLHLATEITPLWQATADSLEDANIEPPFWAFAWPGGQALARHILDHPTLVKDRVVLDLASGSGIVAIAAAKAGAKTVTACDIDSLSIAAIELNAALNGVALSTTDEDLIAGASPTEWDTILSGDVFYERTMATTIAAWLSAGAQSGVSVLASDPGRPYLPDHGVTPVARYTVPTSLDLEDSQSRVTTIWSFTA